MWAETSQNITLISRSYGGRGADGRMTIVEAAASALRATVNPITGEKTQTLPEGEKAEDWRRVLMRTQVFPPDDYSDPQRPGDILVIEGERYLVRDAQEYKRVIRHYEYRVRRLKPGEIGYV